MKSTWKREQRQTLNIVRNLSKQADELTRRLREVCPEEFQEARPDNNDLGGDWFDACEAAIELSEAMASLEATLDPNPSEFDEETADDASNA